VTAPASGFQVLKMCYISSQIHTWAKGITSTVASSEEEEEKWEEEKEEEYLQSECQEVVVGIKARDFNFLASTYEGGWW